jgi:hypothetical protein
MHGGYEKLMQKFEFDNLKGRNNLRDIGADGNTVLNK